MYWACGTHCLLSAVQRNGYIHSLIEGLRWLDERRLGVRDTHCRNRLLDAEVLPRQRTDMTRLLLPAAAVVENGALTSGGSCRNNFVEASGAARGFGAPSPSTSE